jgi:hypothetical protein
MAAARKSVPVIELPPSVLESPGMRKFAAAVSRSGELSPEEAGRFTQLVAELFFGELANRYAAAMAADVEGVFRIREELKAGYTVDVSVASGRAGSVIRSIGAESFERLFDTLLRYVEDIAEARDYLDRPGTFGPEGVKPQWPEVAERLAAEGLVPEAPTARERVAGETAPEPGIVGDEPPPPLAPRQRTHTDAERAFDRVLSEIMLRLDPARGNLSEQRALALEFIELVHQRILEPAGIPRARLGRQLVTGPSLAADLTISPRDPLRGLGYEMFVELPPDLRIGGRQEVRPDGMLFGAGDTFEFAEHKSPMNVDVPAGHYAQPGAQLELLGDLEVRGRLAQRIPQCSGWRYSTDAPWLSDLADYAVRRLSGRPAGDPPPAATPEFLAALNTLAAVPDTPQWAATIRVAP